LGLIGASIGLALRQAEVASVVVGHDINPDVNNQAKRLGAVDRTHWNLVSACEESDLIILSPPLDGIEPSLEAIGPHLRPGCVVMDTATVKEPVMAWAAKHLREGVHFIGGNPVLGVSSDGRGGLEAARADLFQHGLFCLVLSPGTDEAAVKLATDLVGILGAKPLFCDAAEHDGLMAAVEHLPVLLSLTLLDMAVRLPTWRELRKAAGPSFETGTALATTDITGFAELCVANRDNLVRWIDTYSDALSSIRRLVVEGEVEAITGRAQDDLAERQKWLEDRGQGRWYEGPKTELPSRSSMIDNLFGTFWRRKPDKK